MNGTHNLGFKLSLTGVIASLAMLSLPTPAAAQSTWTGAVSGLWGNANNWFPATQPPGGIDQTLTFGAATTTAMTAGSGGTPFQLNQMTFSAGGPAYTMVGNPMDFRTNSASVVPTIVMDTDNPVTIGDPLTLTNNLFVTGAGAGTLRLNGVISGGGGAPLNCSGAGTVTLGGGSNTYTGGTIISSGTLALGVNGAALPAGSAVLVQAGAFLDLRNSTNFLANALGNITLDGGTLLATGTANNSDYYTQSLTMRGGEIDFSNTPYTWIHVTGAAGITTNASATTAKWTVGASTVLPPRIQNNTGSAMPITVALGTTPSGIDLDAGIILSNGDLASGTNPTFIKTGPGTMRLTNTGNTANFTVSQGALRVDDLAALGSGTVALSGGTLAYGGSNSATLTKPLTLTSASSIQVLTDGVKLAVTGGISQTTMGQGVSFYGSFTFGSLANSTISLPNNNNYSGPTVVSGNVVVSLDSLPDGGAPSPIGSSSSAPSNLTVGSFFYGRSTIQITGMNAQYTSNRGITVVGRSYNYFEGGAIDVQNASTNLTLTGQITGAGFVKSGRGSITLTNTTNNYTDTSIDQGTLIVPVIGPVIPANSNVYVNSGGTLQVGPAGGNNSATPLGIVTLNGGTLAIYQSGSGYYINRLETGAAGGLLNLAGGYLAMNGATINGPTTWNGLGSFFYPTAGDITIAGGATLTSHIYGLAHVRVQGGGTMYVLAPTNNYGWVITVAPQSRVRVDDLSITNGYTTVLGVTGYFTLDGGTLQYSGTTVATAFPIALTAAGGGVEVSNAATTLTLTGPITGSGPLAKGGSGVLVLNNVANQFTGGIVVNAGRLDVGDDAQLGAAAIMVNPFGTLRYTASTTAARTFTLNAGALEAPAGVTLTLNGAAVGGGFLRGTGTFAVTGGTVLSGATTFASTTIAVIGPASFVNFANGGPLTVAAGQATPVTLNGFTNKVGGQITVGAASAVNAADFESYGTLTLNPAVVGGGQFTILTNAGASPLNFGGGSRTFLGTPGTATDPNTHQPAFVAGIDLNGQNAVVAGGLFVNNGFVVDSSNGGLGTATVVADYGALVKGAGFFQNGVITQNGGKVQAGNSPGAASFGRLIVGPGGVDNYVFAIDDATGTAGPSPDALGHVSGWGLVKSIQHTAGSATTCGDFIWTASPAAKLTVALDTLLNPTTVGIDVPGPMADFEPSRAYSWLAAEWAGSYSGPTDATALNAATAFDTSGFVNPVAGTFGWSLDAADHSLSLTYTPTAVPEPGTLALVGFAIGGLLVRRSARLYRGTQDAGGPNREPLA